MNITLLDGRVVDTDNIFFDDTDYSFKLGGTAEDITTLIKQADKRTFPGFDVAKYNDIVYAQTYFKQHGTWPPDVGSTSVWVNFVNQLGSGTVLSTAGSYWSDAVSNAVSDVVDSDGFKKILIVGFIGLGLLVLLKSD